MNKKIKKLVKLCNSNPEAKKIFKMWAKMERDRGESPIRVIASKTHIDYSHVVSIMKELGELEVGRFWNGRGSKETRFEFYYSHIEIAEAALGLSTELNPWYGDEEEGSEIDAATRKFADKFIKRMTQATALGLGVDVSKVKIICDL